MASPSDLSFLGRALRLARKGGGGVSPNPMVGAVIVRDGEVVGEGWHRRAGEPHAEALALAAAGERARGATLFVTLEPCAHHGRTPPCADAVVEAGIARVVACHRDPDVRVAGKGFARLRAAGVGVESGFLVSQAIALNWRFLVSTLNRRPAVTVKWAMSLDGKIAAVGGRSRWISSPAARRWALAERVAHDATLVGSGTVLADDPLLTRRGPGAGQPNLRVVLDRRLRTPPGARLFSEPGMVVLYTDAAGAGRDPARVSELQAAGAQVVVLPAVSPSLVLSELHARGVRSVLVEGGATVAASFVHAGLYDRVAVVCAPKLLGGATAPSPLATALVEDPNEAPRVEGLRGHRAGEDLILEGFRSGCSADLFSAVAE